MLPSIREKGVHVLLTLRATSTLHNHDKVFFEKVNILFLLCNLERLHHDWVFSIYTGEERLPLLNYAWADVSPLDVGGTGADRTKGVQVLGDQA